MTEGIDDSTIDLARQICSELTDAEPVGFHFTDHVLRQDRALERLAEQLRSQHNPAEVEGAISHAISATQDGWVLLKLLELADRLSLLGTASALLKMLEQSDNGDPRRQFLHGRACEVLLRLPLNLEMRAAANAACAAPLERMEAFRLGARRERQQQRPRRLEWLLLVALMALAVLGVVFAILALDRT